ncbi:MAG: hypothetical protein ACK5ME_12200 [Parahaliea sp.]
MMNNWRVENSLYEKQKLRNQISNQTKAYLRAGGQVHILAGSGRQKQLRPPASTGDQLLSPDY